MMTSTRPYLIRAFYEWIVDNDCTPYVVVNALYPGVEVPEEYIEDSKIVLNIDMQAVKYLDINNETIFFEARFSGQVYEITVPMEAVMVIYAKENGRGMVFSDEEDIMEAEGQEKTESKTNGKESPNKGQRKGPKKGKPNLKLVE